MYAFFSVLEKIVLNFKCIVKLNYYKLKYGKRLKVGKNLKFRKRFQINISNNGYLEIGDNCFFNNDCSINCHKKIVIGENNLFGENVKLYDHNHIFNDKNINFKKNFTEREILIGDNNWFGSNCIILSKANIGSYNVFSANLSINDKISNENILVLNEQIESKKIKFK